ncbi:MAG: flagellar basal-body MS-ring/collar protein FliF [Thermoleophilaceae bacterium]
MDALRSFIQNSTPKAKLTVGAIVAGVILLGFTMMKIAGQTDYSTVLTGLNPAQTGKLTSALDQKGIKWELQNNGTAIAVDKGQMQQARVALAGQGMPGQMQPGFEIFDKQKLGASDFQQQVMYQRALEGQLAQTIGQIDGVANAQVQLVLPQDQLFQDQQSASRAGVLLTTDGTLQPGAVRGIATLVSNSVKGLSSQNVSITDQTGALMWPTSTDGSGGLSKQAADMRASQALEGQLNALLVQTLGPGKGQVQASADVNANRQNEDAVTYANKGVALSDHKEQEQLAGGGAGGGGAAGTAGNIPSFAQAGAGGGNSNYQHKVQDDTFGVSKKVTHTQVAPGAINKQTVSVVLDKSVPPADVNALKQAITGAAGIDPKRGDTLSVTQVAFAKPKATKPPMVTNVMSYLKFVGLGIGMLLFLFFMKRHLKRREGEEIAAPTWLRELEAPVSLAELEAGNTAVIPQVTGSPLRQQIDDLASRDPEKIAHQVRAWMNDA